ncbi:MAG: AraC family transcriptional regulator [Spirochaetota bacterium]
MKTEKTKTHPVRYSSDSFFASKRRFHIVRNSADDNRPWMVHDFFAMVYILEGSGTYKTSKRQKSVKKGDVYFLNAGEPHRWLVKSGVRNITFYFKRSFVTGILSALPFKPFLKDACLLDFAEGRQNGFFSIPLLAGQSLEVRSIFESMLSEYDEQSDCYEISIQALFTRLLIVLHRFHARKIARIDNEYGREKQAIISALEFIQSNYTRDLTLQEIAVPPLRPEYFSRLFKKHTGYRVIEYLNEMRILKACDLLEHSDKIVIEIARAVGYQNITFFNRMFKKLMHTTPKGYRSAKMRMKKVS